MEWRSKMFNVVDWTIKELTGYEPITTYYTDFGLAEKFGLKEVENTYRRAFKNWHEDIKWMTEICMVLNWKISEHYGRNNELAKLYDRLWRECDSWILDYEEDEKGNIKYKHFTEDEINYYAKTVD